MERAREHDDEQAGRCNSRIIICLQFMAGNRTCILSVHVDDIKGIARKEVAEPLLAHLNKLVGQCNAEWLSFLNTCVQHERGAGVVFTHQCVYVDSISVIEIELLIGKDDGGKCIAELHDS